MRKALVLCLLSTGCGYRFTAGGAPLPEGVRQVAIPILVNKTTEPGWEVTCTQALRTEATRAGNAVDSTANAQISGELSGVGGGPAVVMWGQSPASYRVGATAHVTLLKEGRVVADVIVQGTEDYLPGLDVVQSDANRQGALVRLGAVLMRDAYARLATGW